MFGRGDWIRTSDPLRPRQVRYQAALRPDIRIPLILLHSPVAHVTIASPFGRKLRVRLSFCRASRFICRAQQ
jgi:hypothetical protein